MAPAQLSHYVIPSTYYPYIQNPQYVARSEEIMAPNMVQGMRATDSYRTIRPRNIDPSGEPVCEATYAFAQLSK
jgi:hypothetical protein